MPNEMPTETAKLHELQERLEQNRALALEQRQRSMSSVEGELFTGEERELATCPACRKEFERVVVIIGPSRLKARLCSECDTPDARPGIIPPTRPAESVEDWLAGLGINTRKHGTATIENFDASDAPRAQLAARAFVDETVASGRHDRVRGLYLVSGGKGTGKTHLAVGIVREVHRLRPDIDVVFDPADRLIAKIQDSYGKGFTDELISQRAQAGLYVLDDLGREKDTTDALRTLCTILDEREGAPTVITSNYEPDALGARHSDGDLWARVASRLGDRVYRYVGVEGRDRRFGGAAA